MPKRPVGVLAVSILLFTGSAIALVSGVSLIWPETFLRAIFNLDRNTYIEIASMGKATGWVLVGFGVITAINAYGLLKNRRWAWWMAVVGFLVNLADDAAKLFTGEPLQGIVGMILAGSFLFYLLRPATRAFFENQLTAGQGLPVL